MSEQEVKSMDAPIDTRQDTAGARVSGVSLTVPMFAIHHHKIGGTESAIYNLVHGLARTDARLTLAFSDKERFSPEFRDWMAATPAVAQLQMPAIPGPKNSRFLEETVFEWKRSGDGWALFPNYFLPPRLRHKPAAVILHDIQYKILPQYHTAKRKAWLDFYLPRMFAGADVVFLISESEKRFVAQYFGDRAARKCRVIYNAIGWSRLEGGEIGESVATLMRRPYILTVSHPFPHKNLSTLIKAFNGVAEAVPDVMLYLVGKGSPEKERLIAENATATAAGRIVMTGIVSDAELGELYRNARLFALPSLYEGFGMPAAEAMGLGVPTVVSGVTSLPEATLGKASYVRDPLDASQWTEHIVELLRSGERPSAELTQAVRHAFDPQKVAGSLIDSLR